ncbi:MAG TPA: hemolysin D, partial [Pirellulales bacterium]|nr:hemolysin D [Pirellulales bacterium]
MPLLLPDQRAAGRAIPLRMRADLECRRQTFGGRRYWAVKDPISLKYFHLAADEWFVLTMLDGRTSADEMRRRFNAQFAPRSLGTAQLEAFLSRLHRGGLLLADSPGQGKQLLDRHAKRARRERYHALLGALAIRFRGVNPRPLLDWLWPKCRFLFSPACVAVNLLLAVGAVLLIVVQFDTFHARLPEFRAIVAAENLPWLLVALAATKMMHELGHALACRTFCGDCHEIGFMLLVFVPCLYCNVSDSWMFDNKWRRIAVAAAGIYVELILASTCTFLWWWTEPGLFNSLCLNTMLICSLGTLAINANPLLRYDGYFILSDLVEVPNLAARSRAVLIGYLRRWCLGWDHPGDRGTPARYPELLAAYAVASIAYRWIVVIAVLWGLHELARTYRLELLVFALAAVVGMAAALPIV